MKTRLALIVALLVILPTAVLSVLASRILRDWERTLQRRLEIAAKNAIREVSGQMHLRLEDTQERIRTALAGPLSQGGRYGEISAICGRLEMDSPLAGQVYLFMNPVGFIHPESARRAPAAVEGKKSATKEGAEHESAVAERDRRLAVRLRAEIERATSAAETLFFVADNELYCFSYIRNRKGIYAGYRVSAEGLERLLTSIASLLSSGGFVLSVRLQGARGRGEIVVTDSFSEDRGAASGGMPAKPGRGEGGTLRPTGTEPLASGRLESPFDFIEVTAYLDDAEEVERGGVLQGRLYGWGIFLAAGVIIVGAFLVIREAGREIRAARERSDFVMGVSHDLRTPVSSVRMFAESLYLDHVAEPERRKEFLGMIVKECDRLADMIERVLFLVRQERKAVAYSFAPVDVGDLAQSVAGAFADRAGMKVAENGKRGGTEDGSGTIRLQVADGIPPVNGDWDALGKVLFNLLDNARKYGVGSGKEPIELRADGEEYRGRLYVRLEVRDHGIGIAKREIRKIFHRFYRGESEVHRAAGGVGLGLSICRDIVKSHGGRIDVESEEGKGSTFRVWLPAA